MVNIMYYGKLPILLLAEIDSNDSNSTNCQIAAYILQHLEEVRNSSIKELAEHSFTSMSSISRFCRDLGLKDYNELRKLLTDTELHFEICNESPQLTTSINDYIAKVHDSLELVEKSLNMESIKKLVKDIDAYDRISIFGPMKAESVAMNLQADLLMLGKVVSSKVRYGQQIRYLEQADENDLIIIFSYRGIYFEYEYGNGRINPNLKKPKIYFITSNSHIKKDDIIDEVIYFKSEQNQISHPWQLQLVAGIIAQIYALHIK
jgi:hypothetical protein